MSRSKSTRPSRRAANEPESGLLRPEELWGKALPLRPLYDAALPFDERVARAWDHLKATRFTFDEHQQLREALVKMIEGEQRGGRAGE